MYVWLVYSSANPNKLSATLKGSIAYVLLATLGNAFGIPGVTEVADSGVEVIVQAGQVLSAGLAFVYAVRKVTRTLGGINLALKDRLLK